MHREIIGQRTVRLSGDGCAFTYRRLRPGTVLVTISGNDRGQLGMAPLDELTQEIARFGSLEVYIDARGAQGPSAEVTEHWTAWLGANQHQLRRVAILATSKLVHLIVSIAKVFSRTRDDMIRIYADEPAFTAALLRQVPGFEGLLPAERLGPVGHGAGAEPGHR